MNLCRLTPAVDGHMNSAMSVLGTFNLTLTLSVFHVRNLDATKSGDTSL